jgi:hypothetical protein
MRRQYKKAFSTWRQEFVAVSEIQSFSNVMTQEEIGRMK